MYPVLLQLDAFSLFGYEIAPLSIFSHGLLQAIGFLVAVFWFLKIAQRRHFHLEFFSDHFFSLIFWSLLGARLGYLYVFWNRYEENPTSVLYFWDQGYLLWPGMLAFLLILLFHCSRQKEKLGAWLDVIVPAAVIAFIFDAFGAFLGGDQYGKPTELPWGLSYDNSEVPFTIPIHPVQMYLLFLLLALLIVIQILHQKKLKESKIGLISLALLAMFSFVAEYFRGDEMITLLGLRFTQLLELLTAITSLSLLFLADRRT